MARMAINAGISRGGGMYGGGKRNVCRRNVAALSWIMTYAAISGMKCQYVK